MATCEVFATIIDGAEEPLEGVSVQFVPAANPSVNSTTGKGIVPRPIQVVTSSTGYFVVNLAQNTDFVVIIKSMGLKQKIRIPAETTKNLFELTGAYTSGDATPTDPGGESGW